MEHDTPVDTPDGEMPDGEVPDAGLPPRSVLLLWMVVAVPLLSAVAVAILVSMGTGQPLMQPVIPTARATETAQGSDDARTPRGASRASRDDAASALREAGIRRIVSVVAAWTWRDGDATTLVAVTRRVGRRNANFSARSVTLRVTTVADPDGKARLLATSEDAAPACARGVEMSVDVSPGDVAVRDLDGDGRREVLVAWRRDCGGAPVWRRATVLSGTTAYALAGQGALTAQPDPPRADWPDGFLDAASDALDAAG